ncbi:MAG: polysaccharide deacetylase family protein [Candidatus Omnitrophota bacterium]|jgi:peptidoglycan/xylan/chitin deacetylase (PgdA/CDA1 family)
MFKHKKPAVIIGVVAAAVIFLVNYARHNYVLPILMYHSVKQKVPPGNRLTVSSGTFERQMEFLKRNRYAVVPLEEAVRLVKDKQAPPARTVAITFDDGYGDNYTEAFPILKKYNLLATIFIIVNEIGQPGMLTWEQIHIMQDSGLISFGSHTLNHPYLVKIDSLEALKSELFDSKKIMEKELSRPVNTFCYPSGRFNQKVRQVVVDAGYTAAVASNPGKNFPSDDIFALKRLRISENSSNLFIFWVESSGYYNMMRESKRKSRGKGY